LAQLRVVELGGAANYSLPYAGRLLADLGAEVVMVEPPQGHPLRRGHPQREANPEVAEAVFAHLAAGKRSVVADSTLLSDQAVVRDLVDSAHVVLVLADAAEAYGVAAEDHSGVSFVQVSDWGEGPYAGRPSTGLVLQAAAGLVTSRKEKDLWPVQLGGAFHEWSAGAYIAVAALTLARLARLGHAASTEVSLFECAHSILCYDFLRYEARGELGVSRDRILIAPFGLRRCRDGWVGINTLTQQQWSAACRMTGLEEYVGEQQSLNRGEGDLATFERRLEEFLSTKNVADIVVEGQANRIPVVPVAAGLDMLDYPQWRQRPFFGEAVLAGRALPVPGPAWRLAATPARQVTGQARAEAAAVKP
jgi:crotonobetainyl-CoA:carnitine CoA-transferase CaiB-like acyl-CoA transferase